MKDLPTPDPSEDGGLPWRSPSTDSLDASELGSVLFGHLRTDYSASPTISNNPDTETSPGPNLDHKRIRQFRRSHSEDDNDSLSSVSTASTTSYQRARRPSGLAQPGLYLHNRNPEPNSKLRGLGILTGRRFGDTDSDYISDGGSDASFDSAIRSHKSHRSQRSAKSHGSHLPTPDGNAGLTKLQLQKQMLQQMQPLPANTTMNGTRAHSLPIGQSTTAARAVTGSQPQDDASRHSADSSNGRFSPPRARATATASESKPTATGVQPGTGTGTEGGASTPSTVATKPRSTTPTGIPRAVHSVSHAAHAPTPSHTAQPDPTGLTAEGTETIGRMASSSSQASSAPSGSRTGSLTASEVEIRPGRSTDASANRNGQNRSASVDRGTPVTATRTPEGGRRSASVERGTPQGPLPESALRASAPAPMTVNYTEKKSSPHQHHGSARKFEMKEDPYPERGRLRIRSASISRTSAVESVAPPSAAAQINGRGASHASDHTSNHPMPAHRERERAAAHPQRGASVTRSDSHAASVRAATHTGPASLGAHSTHTHTASGNSAATYRSPPGKANRTNGSNRGTPADRTPNGATSAKRGRTSLGSTGTGAVRSPMVTGAGTAKSPAPARSTTPSSTGARRKSDGVKDIAPKKTPTQKERRFSLPSPTGPVTPPQPATTSASKLPARINTTVVAVPTSRTLTPNRTSSSSLSTTGSLGASGSAPNSRSSTPTSRSGVSTGSGSRVSRRGGTPNRARSTLTPVQLKSLNPYPLRNSLSPRHSLEGNFSSPTETPSSQTRSPTSASSAGRSASAPRGRLSASKPMSPYAAEASSPSLGESDRESLASPISVVHVQNRLLLPPPEAVPFQGSTRPLLFMMSMAHLSQESISGVYDSANYHVGPRHLSRGGRSGQQKYVMRGAESVPAAQARTPERLSLPLPGSPKDDYLHDQGSGNTATTLASASSYDSGDDEPAASSPLQLLR